MEYDKAKELIIQGKLGEALRMLREPLQGTSLYDEWIIIQSRYERMEEKDMKGLLLPQELSIMRNQITDTTLRLLDRAEVDARVPVNTGPSAQAKPAASPKHHLRQLAMAAGLVVLLMAAYWVGTSSQSKGGQTVADQTEEPALPAQPEKREQPQPASPNAPAKARTESERETVPTQPKEAQKPVNDPLEAKENRPGPSAEEIAPAEVATPDRSASDRYDRYHVRKTVGHSQLPFELHEMGIGEAYVYLKMTLHNRNDRDIEVKEVQMLHTGDKSSASSYNLAGQIVAAAQQKAVNAKFRWALGTPAAFRFKIIFRFSDERSWREAKTDFGLYQRIN